MARTNKEYKRLVSQDLLILKFSYLFIVIIPIMVLGVILPEDPQVILLFKKLDDLRKKRRSLLIDFITGYNNREEEIKILRQIKQIANPTYKEKLVKELKSRIIQNSLGIFLIILSIFLFVYFIKNYNIFYESWFLIIGVAITEEQSKDLPASYRKANQNDKNYDSFVVRFGEYVWDLDVYTPEQLGNIVYKALVEFRPVDKIKELRARDKEELDKYKK